MSASLADPSPGQTVLEIGAGKGKFLLYRAQTEPGVNFIGFDYVGYDWGINDFDVKSEQYYLHTDPSIHVLAVTPVPPVKGAFESDGTANMNPGFGFGNWNFEKKDALAGPHANNKPVDPYGATFVDGYRNAVICDAILASAQTGHMVDITY